MSDYCAKTQSQGNPLALQLQLLDSGAELLSDAELISIILANTGSYTPKNLQSKANVIGEPGAAKLSQLTVKELSETYGINRTRASTLVAALELGKRAAAASEISISTPEAALPHLQDMLGLRKEQFRALYLNSKKQLIKSEIVSVGDLNSSVAHPREVFQPAIVHSADSLIVAHNHPSGDPTPSEADINITKCLSQAGELLHIPVVDHIIIGRGSYVSMRRQNMMS